MKRRLTIFIITLLLTVCMATTTFAVTPRLNPPKLPKIPEIKVSFTLPDSVFDNWFKEHPIVFK